MHIYIDINSFIAGFTACCVFELMLLVGYAIYLTRERSDV